MCWAREPRLLTNRVLTGLVYYTLAWSIQTANEQDRGTIFLQLRDMLLTVQLVEHKIALYELV